MSDLPDSIPADATSSPPETPSGTRTYASAWRSRPFRWVWAGSTMAAFGAEIGELAVPLLALVSLSASAGELSALRAAQFAPFLLATLPIGVLVDHARRRPLMVGADLGRFATVALIPIAVWLGFGSIPVVCALLFVVGTLTVLYQSADFALLPHVVAPNQLTDANAKLSASYSTAEISGRGVGGVLVQALTAPAAVLVNSLGYLGSAISLARVRVPEPRPPTRTGGRLDALWFGIRIACRNPVLRGFLGGATTFNLFYEVFLLGVTLYLVRQLEVSAVVFSAVLVAGGVGSLIGSWVGPKLSRRFHYGKVLLGTLALGNSAPLLVGATVLVPRHEVVVVMVTFVLMGTGMGISNAHVVTVRQIVAPPEALGRLNSAYRFVSWGAVPIGATAGGVAATQLGAWGGMLLGAAGLACATVWVAMSPVRRLEVLEDARTYV